MKTDKDHLDDARAVLGGDENTLRKLTEEPVGTTDLDEADRRSRVINEWQRENTERRNPI